MRDRVSALVLICGLLALGAAQAAAQAINGVPSGVQRTRGLPSVESVEVHAPSLRPSTVRVVARGHLPDGCSQLDQVRVSGPNGKTFLIALATVRPARAICTDTLVPFQRTINLDVRGLPAGTYRVVVNGLASSFTITGR